MTLQEILLAVCRVAGRTTLIEGDAANNRGFDGECTAFLLAPTPAAVGARDEKGSREDTRDPLRLQQQHIFVRMCLRNSLMRIK